MEVNEMKISDLEPNSKVINLVATIDSLEKISETPHGTNVQEGVLSDASGQVKLTLWGDQAGKFEIGDKVIITTGWCKTFENNLQVSTGKFGKIEKVPDEKPE
jgi:ssDNA-binding replication factor A large subunit